MAKISTPAMRSAAFTAAKRHILAQGEVIQAANLLQDAFYELFRIALSMDRSEPLVAEIQFHDHALSIWHVIRSDTQQREMALIAISTVPIGINIKPALSRLKWADKQARKLYDYRNILAHTPIMFRARPKGRTLKWVPVLGGQSTRKITNSRLGLVKNLIFWQMIRNDLLKLCDYVTDINNQIRNRYYAHHGAQLVGTSSRLPRRPRLGSAKQLHKIDALLSQKIVRHNKP